MMFSSILKSVEIPKPTGKDVFAMVDGKPSNLQICEDMVADPVENPEVAKYNIQAGVTMGFSQEQAEKLWG